MNGETLQYPFTHLEVEALQYPFIHLGVERHSSTHLYALEWGGTSVSIYTPMRGDALQNPFIRLSVERHSNHEHYQSSTLPVKEELLLLKTFKLTSSLPVSKAILA